MPITLIAKCVVDNDDSFAAYPGSLTVQQKARIAEMYGLSHTIEGEQLNCDELCFNEVELRGDIEHIEFVTLNDSFEDFGDIERDLD